VQASPVLFVFGAVAEFAGIVLLGFPDLLPGAIRLSGWLRRQSNRLRRVVGLPTRPIVVSIGAAGEINIAGRVAALVVSRSGGTLDEKVAFLLRRDQAAQRQENELADRVDQLEAESRQRIADAQREMEQHIAAETEAYRPLRIAGTAALALGLALTTVATLIA